MSAELMYSSKAPMFTENDLTRMLRELEVSGGFTDMYISVGQTVRIKRNKRLFHFTNRVIKEEEIKAFLYAATQDRSAGSVIQASQKALSGAFSIGHRHHDFHHRYRYEASQGRDERGRHTISIVIRSLSSEPVPLNKQGVASDLVKAVTSKESGLALIGGATGSGKTTFLSGIIEDALTSGDKNDRVIRTIEDPIEIVYDDKERYGENVIEQHEIGKDFTSFALAIRSFLRQGPTDILVGEMRDLETIQETLKAANTGHRVFGTIHVNQVPDIPARIVSEFPEESRRGRMLEFLGISKAWVVQRLEINPNGGLTALRSHLQLTPNLLNELFDVHPDNIRAKANELLEAHGVTMERAAHQALENGTIDELTYQIIKWGA